MVNTARLEQRIIKETEEPLYDEQGRYLPLVKAVEELKQRMGPYEPLPPHSLPDALKCPQCSKGLAPGMRCVFCGWQRWKGPRQGIIPGTLMK